MIDSLLAAQVFDLAQPLEATMPAQPAAVPYRIAMTRRHGDVEWAPDRMSAAVEQITMSTHIGTHVDALGHVSHNGRLHGDVSAEEAQRGGRLRELGVETISPFLYRGVLLDIAALRGVDRLPPEEAVTGKDFAEACQAQGVEVTPRCALLVRTGWGDRDFYRTQQYFQAPPGPDLSAAEWLIERRVALTGSDTSMYEQATLDHVATPVHRALLVEAGIYIAESLYLEELAFANVYTFGLVMAPLLLVGASGSPIRPLALSW